MWTYLYIELFIVLLWLLRICKVEVTSIYRNPRVQEKDPIPLKKKISIHPYHNEYMSHLPNLYSIMNSNKPLPLGEKQWIQVLKVLQKPFKLSASQGIQAIYQKIMLSSFLHKTHVKYLHELVLLWLRFEKNDSLVGNSKYIWVNNPIPWES